MNNFNYKKDAKSPEKFIEKYGDKWIFEAIKLFKDYKIYKKCLLESGTDFNIFKKKFVEISNFKSILNTIYPICKSSYFQTYFNLEFKDILEGIIKEYGIINSSFGNIRFFNGHICRSDGEFEISKYLVNNNINYIYEKKYKNTSTDKRIGYKSDFYLPDYDVYIEYMGMYEKFNYKNHYLKKQQFCSLNGFEVIFEQSVDKIKEKINEITNKGTI